MNETEIRNYLSTLTVGICYNVKKHVDTSTIDAEAEYDNITTVEAIKHSLELCGCAVELFEEDGAILDKLKESHIDIVFNIAEGHGGRGREAQVPAILNLYGISYTGSDETTLCVALDKALTKRVLCTYHIKTPKYFYASKDKPIKATGLTFPVILKPNAEGSSKGISEVSVVNNHKQLVEVVKHLFNSYHQDVLIEEYIEGREFTVGLLGNGKDVTVFEPMEIKFNKPTQDSYCVYSYTVKQIYEQYVQYVCPPELTEQQSKKIKQTAKNIFNILGCNDFARVDFRMANDGTLHFIEINPLPGLAPNYSDFPMLANFCGVDYDTLIYRILTTALKRLGKIG
ncbi:MAG: ATP-grasp domain-containing protein [Clostridia bacterium]